VEARGADVNGVEYVALGDEQVLPTVVIEI
jgi:hypothetical protein